LPDPRKVEAIKNYPRPTDEKQLKSCFDKASYYRKFIPNSSRIAAPLYALLKANVSFEWATERISVSETNEKLLSKPILQYPDFTKELILATDASNKGLGAILSQAETGKDLSIACASINLNKAEKNYSTCERKLLAVVWRVKRTIFIMAGNQR
jgi:hypothetical protein